MLALLTTTMNFRIKGVEDSLTTLSGVPKAIPQQMGKVIITQQGVVNSLDVSTNVLCLASLSYQ